MVTLVKADLHPLDLAYLQVTQEIVEEARRCLSKALEIILREEFDEGATDEIPGIIANMQDAGFVIDQANDKVTPPTLV